MGTSRRFLFECSKKYKTCPICPKVDMSGKYEDWLVHLSETHKSMVIKIGDLFWIGCSEVIYKGKHYK